MTPPSAVTAGLSSNLAPMSHKLPIRPQLSPSAQAETSKTLHKRSCKRFQLPGMPSQRSFERFQIPNSPS